MSIRIQGSVSDFQIVLLRLASVLTLSSFVTGTYSDSFPGRGRLRVKVCRNAVAIAPAASRVWTIRAC